MRWITNKTEIFHCGLYFVVSWERFRSIQRGHTIHLLYCICCGKGLCALSVTPIHHFLLVVVGLLAVGTQYLCVDRTPTNFHLVIKIGKRVKVELNEKNEKNG